MKNQIADEMTEKSALAPLENNARWWESYFVRYAIGAVIGALCVYALLDASGRDVMAKAMMVPPITQQQIDVLTNACRDANVNACVAQLQLYQDLYGFNLPQLILLGIYGLGYCYIASAPGLVVHAIRRQLMSESKPVWYANTKFAAGFIAAIFIVSAVVWKCGNTVAAAWTVLFFAALLILWQLWLLFNECRQDAKTLNFYTRLHRARQSEKFPLDSYRHLREHGNAFFIVVLELMFLAVAFSVSTLFGASPYWPAWLVLWIVPGAAVYFLGHKIESMMIQRN